MKQDKLENSHIIPSFVFRWLKETSATGFLRFGQTPNRRSQDGYKEYWLCPECEDLFSRWETEFANADALKHFPSPLQQEAERALARWAEFLLGRQPHPGKYEQHMWPLDLVVDHTVRDISPNINRYFLRTVAIDAVCSDRDAFVYIKLPYVFLIGFIHMKRPKEWDGTKVHVRQGVLGSSQYNHPRYFFEYMMGRARRMREIEESISGKQQEMIEQSFNKNLDRFAGSKTFKAMEADIALFGSEAFGKTRNS